MVFITVSDTYDKDPEEYKVFDWDVQIDPAVRSQVHMLWKRPNIFMILLRQKNLDMYTMWNPHFSSLPIIHLDFQRYLMRNYSKQQVILYFILLKKESNFPSVPSHQSFWKISLTISLQHNAWTKKYPKGIPSYAGATAISYVKCDF